MKLLLTIITIIFAALQVIINYAWQLNNGNLKQQFASSLRMFYGDVPIWTEFAFALGNWWYVISFAVAVLAIVSHFINQPKKTTILITAIAIFGTLAMAYAMYPIHLMVSGSWILE